MCRAPTRVDPPGVVNEHVGAAVFFDRSDGRGECFGCGQVEWKHHVFGPVGLAAGLCHGMQSVSTPGRQYQSGAGIGESMRQSRADTSRCAGNPYNFAVKVWYQGHERDSRECRAPV